MTYFAHEKLKTVAIIEKRLIKNTQMIGECTLPSIRVYFYFVFLIKIENRRLDCWLFFVIRMKTFYA